jgi:chorismate mutase
MNRRDWLSLACVALAAGIAGCAAPPTPSGAELTKLDRLTGVMSRRLAISEDVARIKWNTKAPVEDLPREQAVLALARKLATQAKLDPDLTAAFFAAQIEASKSVQTALIARWTEERKPPFANVPDLGRDLRPQLDRLTFDLLAAFAAAQPALTSADDREWFAGRARRELKGFPGGDKTASDALAWLKTYEQERKGK